MQGWLKGNSPSTWEKEIEMVRNLVLLLKCLKIMENATFLSKENQVQLKVILIPTSTHYISNVCQCYPGSACEMFQDHFRIIGFSVVINKEINIYICSFVPEPLATNEREVGSDGKAHIFHRTCYKYHQYSIR